MSNISSSNGHKANVPKLRFPEFEREWEIEKLSCFVERVTRKNTNNQTNLPLTISSKDGLIDQITYFNKKVSSKDMSGYYLLKNGEFAYNKSYSVGYDFGSIKRLDRYPMGALSTLYICFSPKKHRSDFLKIYFDSLKWYKEIYMIAAEGARNHGLLNVPTEDFFGTQHSLPADEKEQSKIADFLTLVEQRIEKQRQLVEALKLYKRGVENRIFDQKISFMQNKEKWSEVIIANLFYPIADRNHPDDTVLTIVQGTGTIPRDSIDRKISYDKSTVGTYKKVQKNDYILHLRSFEAGLEIANSGGIVSPAYTILRAKSNIAPTFYYSYFRSYQFINNKLRIAVEGIRDGKSINMNTFWNIKIPTPHLEEQLHISNLLDLLKIKVKFEAGLLNELQEAKQFLLQQMLI